MHIQNRIADIKALITHALQDYFLLDIVSQYPGDGWKQQFSMIVNSGASNPKWKVNYIETYNKLQRLGLAAYTVQDMDISIILTVLGHSQFRTHVHDKIRKWFGAIQETRNLDSHSSYNQDWSALFQEALATLQILRNFVNAVAAHSASSQRTAYYQKYDQEITILSELLQDDYDEYRRECDLEKQMEKDISEVCMSNDPNNTFHNAKEKYRLHYGLDVMVQFYIRASNAGIPYGCPFLADLYFEGLMRPVDYKKAAELYEKGEDYLLPHQILRLASIYINQISTKRSKEDGLQMVATCKPSFRDEICTYTTQEGYTFYGTRRKKN